MTNNMTTPIKLISKVFPHTTFYIIYAGADRWNTVFSQNNHVPLHFLEKPRMSFAAVCSFVEKPHSHIVKLRCQHLRSRRVVSHNETKNRKISRPA